MRLKDFLTIRDFDGDKLENRLHAQKAIMPELMKQATAWRRPR